MTTSSHLERRGGMGGKPTNVKSPSAIVASFTVFGDVFCDNAVVLPTASDSKLNPPHLLARVGTSLSPVPLGLVERTRNARCNSQLRRR